MKNFTKNTLTLATMAILSASIVGTAQADVMAYSNLNINGLKFLNHNNGTNPFQLTDGVDIQVLNFTNSSNNSAGLTSIPGTASNTINPNLANMACQGSCASIVEDTFAQQSSGNFARGDTLLTGSILTDFGAAGFGARGNSVAEVQLNTNDKGVSSSNIQLNAGFGFILSQNATIAFEFNSTGELYAAQTAGNNIPPSDAQASAAFSITIRDTFGGTVFSWSPDSISNNAAFANDTLDGANLNDTVAAPFSPQSSSLNLGGNFYASSLIDLMQGVQYTLAISHFSSATATNDVPEPATLALFGLGLAGVGALRRRKAKA